MTIRRSPIAVCTAAAAKMAARLRKAGLPETGLHPFAVPEHPKEGGLVAVLNGRDPTARPILLLAHIDVVEARREDWTRDPSKLVEENGYFYARGVGDDKAMASVWVDTFVRFVQHGFKPHRTLKIALTCGEETSGAFNGAQYLSTQRRDRIDATREYFTRMADLKSGDMGSAMRALVKDPMDASAVATVTTDPTYNAMLRTTCVATMLDGGHASNVLPQRARANVNCRIYPDQTFQDVRQELARTSSIPTSAVSTASTNGFARVRCTRAATSFTNS